VHPWQEAEIARNRKKCSQQRQCPGGPSPHSPDTKVSERGLPCPQHEPEREYERPLDDYASKNPEQEALFTRAMNRCGNVERDRSGNDPDPSGHPDTQGQRLHPTQKPTRPSAIGSDSRYTCFHDESPQEAKFTTKDLALRNTDLSGGEFPAYLGQGRSLETGL
jgi:hypothetical protein